MMTKRNTVCFVTLGVVLALTLINPSTIKAQASRQTRPAKVIPEGELVTLQGAVGFAKGYQPKPDEAALLKGLVLILKDTKTGKQVARATSDARGNFAFTNVPASGNSNPVNNKAACPDPPPEGYFCYSFLPAEDNELPLLDAEDPPFKYPERLASGAPPKIVLKTFTCVSLDRKTEIKLYAKKLDPGKPKAQPR